MRPLPPYAIQSTIDLWKIMRIFDRIVIDVRGTVSVGTIDKSSVTIYNFLKIFHEHFHHEMLLTWAGRVGQKILKLNDFQSCFSDFTFYDALESPENVIHQIVSPDKAVMKNDT